MQLRRTCGGLAASALALALCAPAAQGVEIAVPCTTAGLVSAVTAANMAAGSDTLNLPNRCSYQLTTVDNNWYGPNGLPPIASTITIEGNGSTIARSPTAPKFRLFFVGANPNAAGTPGYVTPGPGDLTLQDVTLEGGLAQGGDSNGGGGAGGMGGAIFNQGTVLIERSTLDGNTAQGGSAVNSAAGPGGGGIGTDAPTGAPTSGGGFGAGTFTGGAAGGAGAAGGGGGGAGFKTTDAGNAATAGAAGAGGGTLSGLAGFGGSDGFPAGGGGNGGGGGGGEGSSESGGAFGQGGIGGGSLAGGGGGGVGGGGASGGAAGGGGFGGGGGAAEHSPGSGDGPGGDGGFAGGGGGGAGNAPGFGGGAGTPSPTQRGGGGAGLGGAIFNMQARLEIRNSTFTGDTAVGGAADPAGNPGQGMGGALFNLSGEAKEIDSTFAGTTAAEGGASIYNLVYDASVSPRQALATVRDTILADGTGPADLVSDKPAAVVGGTNSPAGQALASAGDFDLVETSAPRGGGTIFGTPLSTDPQLGPLQDNGGLTKTLAPALSSPAVDAGSGQGLTTDQRGLSRPFDAPAVANAPGGDGSDIGAFERQGGEFPPPPTTTGTGATGSTGGASGGGGATGATTLGPPGGPGAAFGDRTLVTLALRSKRLAGGRLAVVVTNANDFAVQGALTAESARAVAAAKRRKRVVRSASQAFSVAAGFKATVTVTLPVALRRLLARKHKLALRLRAQVRDPAGNARAVTQAATTRLKAKRKR
jgi:hypothetical protein